MRGTEGHLVNGRYRLVAAVGRGGMGRVWRARDETLDREVAVKELLIPAELTERERDDLIARTMREARAAARLRHPGIITIHDVVEDGGVPWVVMEFVHGPSLAQAVKDEGRLARERVAAFGADLADALAHAHSLGIVHRDLKPDNVLLSGTRAVITDFGIAKIMDVETRLTHTGTVIGTPRFMSPEQLENRAVEAPSDVWSLGVTLYSAVEGRAPFEGATLTGLVTAILTQPVPQPEFAGPLGPVLAAMLAKDADQRPDAAGVRDRMRSLTDATVPYQAPYAAPAGEERTLRYEPTKVEQQGFHPTAEQAQQGQPAQYGRQAPLGQQPPQGAYGQQRLYGGNGGNGGPGGQQGVPQGAVGPSRTSPMPTSVMPGSTGPVSVAGPGGGMGGPGGLGGPGGADAEGASRRRVIFGGAAAVVAIAGAAIGATQLLGPKHDSTNGSSKNNPGDGASSSTPTKQSSASPTSSASTPAPSFTAQSPHVYSGHSDRVFFVAFAPDGTMASASADKTIRLWDTVKQKQSAKLEGHSDIVFSVAFSPDGKMLASGSADGTIIVWDVASGDRQTILRPPKSSGLVGPVAFSTDGKVVASGSNDGVVRLWPVGGGDPQELQGHSKVVEALAFSPDGNYLASGSDDTTAILWSVSSGKAVATLQHPDQVHGLGFSSDSKTLATACFDMKAHLWDVKTRQPAGTLDGATGKLEAVAFSPASPSYIATGGWDSSTRIYAADGTGKQVQSLGQHKQTVESVAFSHDGSLLASCGADATIVVWKVG